MAGEDEKYTGRSREELRAIQEQYDEEIASRKKRKGLVDEKQVIKKRIAQRKSQRKKEAKKSRNSGYSSTPKEQESRKRKKGNYATKHESSGRRVTDVQGKRSKIKQELGNNGSAKTKNSTENPQVDGSTNTRYEDNPNDVQQLVKRIRNGELPNQEASQASTGERHIKAGRTGISGIGTETERIKLDNMKLNVESPGVEEERQIEGNYKKWGNYNTPENTIPNVNAQKTEIPEINIDKNNAGQNTQYNEKGNSSTADAGNVPDMHIDLGRVGTAESRTKRADSNNSNKKTNVLEGAAISEATRQAIIEKNSNQDIARKTIDTADKLKQGTGEITRTINDGSKLLASKAVQNSAKKGMSLLGKTKFKGLSFVAKLGCIGSIVWVLVFLLMIIGALSFIMNMPAMVIDNMKDWMNDTWSMLRGYIVGQDKQSDTKVEKLATDLHALGVDLEYWGFASDFTIDAKTNRVDTLKTKYLPVYLAADQRNYMVANSLETISLSSIFYKFANLFSEDVSLGTGLLRINEEATKLLVIEGNNNNAILASIENKVKVNRITKEMIISRVGYDVGDDGEGIEAYRFKLKYWLEKYATPIDFYIALHIATGAPEFVYQMAENPTQGDGIGEGNTKIDINIKALMPNVDYKMEIVYLDIDPKTNKVKIGSDGYPVTLTVPEIRAKLNAGETVVGLSNNPAKDEILARAEKFDATNLIAYTPYITKVINHWYYKEIVYQGTTQSGKNVNVYEVEELPADNPSRVRYQMYEVVQVPGYSGPGESDTEGSGNSGGTSGSTGSEGGNSGDNSSGGSNNGGGVSSGNAQHPGEVGTGDDRQELAQNTQIAEDSGLSSGGFFGSILDLINSVTGWIGSFGGITGMIFDLPSQILNSSYSSLANLINGVMPSNLLNSISNGWLSGLGYYANGMIPNIGNLNYGLIGNTLGINKLQSILSPSNLMNSLGLGELRGTLINISNLTNINQIPGLVANALEVPELTGTFTGVTNMLQNGLTTDSLVNTMYAGLSTQMKDELSSQVLNYAKIAFNGVSSGDAPTIAAGLIGGIATDLTNRTTNEFFNNLQSELTQQLNGQFNVQVEQLLQNENSKQLTGLTINELESMAQVNNLDFNKIEEVNEDITKIQESVNESTTASRELSNIVNEIAEDYAGIDAVTFYYVAKTIREIFTELDNATKQIDSFEEMFKNYSLDERTTLQITTNIERAREAIENARTSIQELEVTDTRSYGTNLSTAGTEIARIIDTNKDKMNAATAAILIAQGNATAEILSTAGDMVQKIDVNTIKNFKAMNVNITLEGFLDTADKLAAIDPTLNGLIEEIEKLDNELKDVNKENSEELVNKINQYENNIDNIEWLTNSERKRLKTQVSTLRSKVNNINNNVSSANLALINALSGSITGITTYKINTLANQILNLPNATISQLLNTVRQIPTDLINQVSRAFTEKVAEAIATETKRQLAAKVEEGLTETLNGEGQLTNALQTRTSNAKGDMSSEEQPLEDSKDEILTGFYIKETRFRDYMQKSEPILVPYSFEHWKKLLVTNKYILTGDYGAAYNTLMQQMSDSEKEKLLENEALIQKYGTSIWKGTGGNLEEAIYAELQSMPSVDSQYLLRYFKELFATYGDELRAAANNEEIKETDNTKYSIGWIFRTEKVTEIINTETRETRVVDKSEYEPVAWTKGNSGTLYSIINDPVYGFKAGIDIVAPTTAVVVSKTDAKVNELGEKVLPTITLQIKSSDNNINGMRVIIRGGDFSKATVGSTVTKDQVIGTTTTDNIMILVLAKGSHAQVDDVSKYVYPPYVTVNN